MRKVLVITALSLCYVLCFSLFTNGVSSVGFANLVSDIEGPTITSVDISDESVTSGDEVYVWVGFSDDSVMDRIALGVKNPGGTVQYFNCYDDSSSGVCEFTLTIGEGHFVQAGEYEIDNVQAYDEYGNATIELSAYSALDMPIFTASVHGNNPTISIPSLTLWGMVGTSIGLVLLFIWRAQRRQVYRVRILPLHIRGAHRHTKF